MDGYEILEIIHVGAKTYVLGENSDSEFPFAVWQEGEHLYIRYFSDNLTAVQDLGTRPEKMLDLVTLGINKEGPFFNTLSACNVFIF